MFRSIIGVAAAAAIALAHAPAPAAPPEKIPLEAFGALPRVANPHISPDGRKLLSFADANGTKAILVYELEGASGRYSRINVPEDLEVLAARWAGNRRVLLTVYGLTKFDGLEVPITRLFLHDLDAGALKGLGGSRIGGLSGGEVVHVDPAGQFVLVAAQALLTETPAVMRIDLDTLKTREVVAPRAGVWTWYADPTGAVRAGLGGDADRWWLYYREKEGERFRRVEARRPDEESLFDVETVVPVAGTDKGYVIANKATGRYGVYRYDFATGAILDPVFEHPEADVEAVAYSLRTGELAAISYADDRDRVHWLDKEMAAIQAKLDKALPDRVNRIVSTDASDNRMIVWSTGGSEPGVYYLYDRSRREMTEVARPYPALEGKPLAPVEAVRYRARDGLSIPAYLTKPLGRPEKGLPLIVMPHGGPFHRDTWAYDSWVQLLANRGYAVLQPNFRGSTGFGKAFVDAASGQWGRKMQDDLDDGVRWLVDKGLVDAKRVCIMGGSYGGYAAMWAAARNPEIYRCAVSFAGISEVRTMLRYDPSSGIARRYYRDWRDRIRGTGDFDLDAVSPLAQAGRIRVPLLIAHGEKDTNVPPGQSKKMHEALLRAKIDHEFVLYPGERHGFSKVENSVDFLRRVEAFLARHNPAE